MSIRCKFPKTIDDNLFNNKTRPDIIVCALEGVHGCGKTSTVEYIRRHFDTFGDVKYHILDEHFDAYSNAKKTFEAGTIEEEDPIPQTIGRECTWIGEWFTNCLRKVRNLHTERQTEFVERSKLFCNSNPTAFRRRDVVFVDRSPLSGCMYADYDSSLNAHTQNLMMHNFSEFVIAAIDDFENKCLRYYNLVVRVVIIPIQLPKATLFNRISARLISEPFRAKFKEDCVEHNETILARYESLRLYIPELTTVVQTKGSFDALRRCIPRHDPPSRFRLIPVSNDNDVESVVSKIFVTLMFWCYDLYSVAGSTKHHGMAFGIFRGTDDYMIDPYELDATVEYPSTDDCNAFARLFNYVLIEAPSRLPALDKNMFDMDI